MLLHSHWLAYNKLRSGKCILWTRGLTGMPVQTQRLKGNNYVASQLRGRTAGCVVVLLAFLLSHPVPMAAQQQAASEATQHIARMTEKEFDAFVRRRSRFRDLSWFVRESQITEMSQEELRQWEVESRGAHWRPYFVLLPTRLAAFAARRVSIRLTDHKPVEVDRLIAGFSYFPEINDVSIELDEPASDLVALLQGLRKITGLYRLTIVNRSTDQAAALSCEEMTALSKHPSLMRLELGLCRLAPGCLSRLADLKTLEEITLGPGATSDCFVTLAKLPKIRDVYFHETSNLDAPIDATVQRAIESLNGRLDAVSAGEVPTTVHASLARALLNVTSLKVLSIDNLGPGLTVADVAQLQGMSKLIRLQFPVDGSYFAKNPADQARANAIVRSVERKIAAARATRRVSP